MTLVGSSYDLRQGFRYQPLWRCDVTYTQQRSSEPYFHCCLTHSRLCHGINSSDLTFSPSPSPPHPHTTQLTQMQQSPKKRSSRPLQKAHVKERQQRSNLHGESSQRDDSSRSSTVECRCLLNKLLPNCGLDQTSVVPELSFWVPLRPTTVSDGALPVSSSPRQCSE